MNGILSTKIKLRSLDSSVNVVVVVVVVLHQGLMAVRPTPSEDFAQRASRARNYTH